MVPTQWKRLLLAPVAGYCGPYSCQRDRLTPVAGYSLVAAPSGPFACQRVIVHYHASEASISLFNSTYTREDLAPLRGFCWPPLRVRLVPVASFSGPSSREEGDPMSTSCRILSRERSELVS